ncbi:MAG: HDOD domain-containing protein [Microbacteriaceae bacterium]|nr:HDOD domain-containing protein [Burkholderiaceae bacterium]
MPPRPANGRAGQPGQRLGRFRLLAELGRGAQAVVWRAHDERLDREVALKLLVGESATQPVSQWLHEARAVSRLAHPHIVPVFDADEIDGQAFLVFELVSGRTLAEVLRRSGAMKQRDAVELMLGVIDALRAAHGHGIVHRDLKPSNILIDTEGRAKVMDFGIAARLAPSAGGPAVVDGLAGCIVGTPGYLSPEAAAGLAPSPQMDVFAAGLVLGELLGGQPLLVERDARSALHRVQREDLWLATSADADDRLRGIVQRAIARDPAQRYDTAASLRDALMQWLAPVDETLPETSSGHGTLDFLLRRMRHKSDFPALTEHVLRIQRMANSEVESLHTLADEILKDVALTQKLLRLVNTAHLRRDSHGVSTISRAVALVGLAGIRNLALSLVLVEHMKDKAHAQRLKEQFLRSLLAGQLAHALAPSARDSEEAFLGAMFYNLGQLLTEYYFPEEADAIRAQLRLTASAAGTLAAPFRLHPDVAADRAAALVMGLGFEALGVGVARHWGLPETLQRCMRRPETASPAQPMAAGPERLRWLAVAANELSDAIWQADEVTLAARLDAVAQRHGRALGLSVADLGRAVEAARQVLAQMAPAMGLSLPKGSRGQRVLVSGEAPEVVDMLTAHRLAATEAPTVRLPSMARTQGPVAAAGAISALSGPALPGLALPGAAAGLAIAESGPNPAVTDMLAAGIQDITDTLAGDSFRLNEVLRMVLETMYRALGFQRMVFCLRDASTGQLKGRFGLGDQAAALSPRFQVPLRWPAGRPPDLFGAVCLKGSDTQIVDSRQPAIAQRLPDWYRQHVNAPSFLLLPMMMKGAPFAMIYADQARPGALVVGERELALLRTLRNQAVVAFRQAGQSV